jgi:hypothetical protein
MSIPYIPNIQPYQYEWAFFIFSILFILYGILNSISILTFFGLIFLLAWLFTCGWKFLEHYCDTHLASDRDDLTQAYLIGFCFFSIFYILIILRQVLGITVIRIN